MMQGGTSTEDKLSKEPLEKRKAIAAKWIERLEAEIKLLETAHSNWKVYAEQLRNLIELEDQLNIAPLNGHVKVTTEATRTRSITDLLIYFAYQQPNYEITLKVAAEWTLAQHIYSDREAAVRGVNGIVGHRKKMFHRLSRGVYRLTERGKDSGQSLAGEMQQLSLHV